MSRPDDTGEPRDGVIDALLAPIDARPGPARRMSSAASADLVRAVLDAALAAEAASGIDAAGSPALVPVPSPTPARAPPPPRWRLRVVLAAGVLGALSLASGAGAVALRFFDVGLGGAELIPEPPAPRPPAPRSSRTPAPPPPLEVELPRGIVEPQPEVPVVARPPRRPPAPVALPAPAPAPAPAPELAVAVPENLPPADLLAFANERRARRAWREADLFYAATAARFPGTDAAFVAEVASAALHLQHLGDAAGALAAYERTLRARPSGPVAEEARWGIAEAHRALGDGRAEALALRELLDHHPDSALAAAARRRLALLDR